MKNNVSVIIPAYNEQDYICGILTDLESQTKKPAEIIVVDGQSRDATRKKVRRFESVTLLVCPPNVASQRNFGARTATSPLLIFLDADTRLKPDFIEKAIKQFQQRKLAIACPIFLPYKSTVVITLIYLFFNTMFVVFQKIAASGAGSCLIIKKAVWAKAKGFNPDVKYEDIEFIRRVSRKERFAILPTSMYVSDRRFVKYGVIKTVIQYLVLSVLFLGNQFNFRGFSYNLGNFKKQSRS